MIDFSTFLPPKECDRPYSISQINDGIATIIESENTLVWVEGEISNFKHASSGHCYFRLKDDQSQIPAVMWRSTVEKHSFEPEDGMAITAIASIRVYRKGGYYQLDIHKMQPSGIGALFAAFEKLKSKLEAEGLFDPVYKKPLPESIKTVGVITAKTGAAVRDILKVIASRAPGTNILLRSTPVQGEQAPGEIVLALREMNDHGAVDCIILGRGGGSIEDLWAFNDEGAVRAIFESSIPVISAVGHEIDFTLSDFVADVRAATPSAAAEMAVSDERDDKRYFRELTKRFTSMIQHYFISVNETYNDVIYNPVFKRALHFISDARQMRDALHEQTIRLTGNIIQKKRAMIIKSAAQMQALNPLSVLSRGYSVVSREGRHPVKDSSKLKRGENIHIQFFKGEASADITSVNN